MPNTRTASRLGLGTRRSRRSRVEALAAANRNCAAWAAAGRPPKARRRPWRWACCSSVRRA